MSSIIGSLSRKFIHPNNGAILMECVRHRANYFKEKGFKKYLRKFLIRNPNSPQYVLIGGLLSVIVFQMGRFYVISKSMSRDELIDYRNRHNAVVLERARSGSNMYFPFLTKDIAKDQDETTQKIFAESDMVPSRTSIY